MKDVHNRDFANRLSRLMSERRMTVRAAATYARVASSTVQNWRSGHSPTDFSAVKRLAEALEVSFSFLMTGEEDELSARRVPALAEYFEFNELLFDGFAKITIQPLTLRARS